MTRIIVACGCGRKMHPDACKGRGAWACGCGTRVQVDVTHKSACVGQREEGSPCRYLPAIGSREFGVALCGEHLEGYMAMLDLIRDGEVARNKINDLYKIERHGGSPYRRMTPEEEAEADRQALAKAVVYYIRIDRHIKIGTTINMIERMDALNPEEIMATEPGYKELEKMRHQQFAHLWIRGEWFHQTDELMSHITMIRDHFGEPVTDTNGHGSRVVSVLRANGAPL